MEFLKSLLPNDDYYGVAILNNNKVIWLSVNKHTLCCNLYNIVSNIFNKNVKSIENEKENIIPYRSKRKILIYLEDGFCIKCFS